MIVLLSYGLHVLPPLLLFGLWFAMTPAAATGLRIAILLSGFVLMRDAMTPLGIWAPGANMQIAFLPQPMVLAGLGIASLAIAACLVRFLPDLGNLLVMTRGGKAAGAGVGVAAGILVALPLLLLNGFAMDRFAVAPVWVLAMAVLAYGGNALEEVLFRGFLQGYLETLMPALRADRQRGRLRGLPRIPGFHGHADRLADPYLHACGGHRLRAGAHALRARARRSDARDGDLPDLGSHVGLVDDEEADMHRAVFYEFHEGDPAVDKVAYRSSTDEVTILPATGKA